MENKSKYSPKFTVPENYFEEFDARMMQKIEETQLPKSPGFTVPDGYFDSVEETILQNNIPQQQNVQVLSLHKQRIFKIVATVAACFAIFMTIDFFSPLSTSSIEDIDTASISAYIEDGNIDYSTDEIASYLKEEDLSTLEISTESITKENLTDYLLNHIDDNTFLTE